MEFWDRVKWDVRRIWHQARKVMLRGRMGERWEEAGDFDHRRYPDYATYLEHQKTKFSASRSSSVMRHDRRFHPVLVGRLDALPIDFRGASELDRIVTEVGQVLRPDGAFVVEANAAGENDSASAGPYEATAWKNVDTLVARIAGEGFELESRKAFEVPWSGEQVVLRRVAVP